MWIWEHFSSEEPVCPSKSLLRSKKAKIQITLRLRSLKKLNLIEPGIGSMKISSIWYDTMAFVRCCKALYYGWAENMCNFKRWLWIHLVRIRLHSKIWITELHSIWSTWRVAAPSCSFFAILLVVFMYTVAGRAGYLPTIPWAQWVLSSAIQKFVWPDLQLQLHLISSEFTPQEEVLDLVESRAAVAKHFHNSKISILAFLLVARFFQYFNRCFSRNRLVVRVSE